MSLEDKSLRDELVEAFRSETKSSDPAPSSEPVASEPAKEVAKEAPKPAAEPKNITGTETPSEPSKAPKEPAKEVAKGGDKAAATEELHPPVRWTKTQKERFYSWPKEVQQQVLEENKGYQADYTRKSMEIAQERKRYEGFEKVLAPRRNTWAQQGLSDEAALEQIMRYWDHAGRDPMGFIQDFARQRGVDLAAKFAPTREQLDAYFAQYYASVTGQRPPANANSEVPVALRQELEQLKRDNLQLRQAIGQTQQFLGTREQQEHQRLWHSVADELRTFESATDASGQPKYPFFQELREDMARLLDTGICTTLEQAYDKATRLRDDVFSRIQESNEAARVRAEEQRRAAEAAAAKRAGASVSSSSVAYTEPSPAGQERSLREELEHAFKASYSRR